MKNNSKNLNLFQPLDDEQLGKITGGALQFIQNTASGALYYNTKTHKYQYQQTSGAMGAAINVFNQQGINW
ncbi:lactococcin family bacteriocin [Lactococcus lactis]|uniref:lactococcin family bacteriocin n=1 Tax=Lactococcus lactis TaxID=1358 RepID=UPI0028913F7A|nr:lactococcin family bacteriocin [Lactococcus lactis]MDT2859313.1 lactococcin family bacteriocin [Lactococcus lactis]MDT2878994.1 lactococcin family bacteriocin [Lactococcus lactis]MDT2896631.1 lactococcin family bacteriocin [Lactococcus lactis]MDT2907009.1 lactococcin family bacteriocin [Lactococcus lactis]MDT2916868.1 lactococcin family bacteriocin [Lactococcus lactis]